MNCDLKMKLQVSRMYNIAITIAFCCLAIIFMKNMNSSTDKYVELQNANTDMQNTYAYLETRVQSMSETIVSLMDAAQVLDEENQELVASNNEYYSRILEYEKREELYDKYEYAIYSGKDRTDITYEQLETLETLVADSKIKDEDLILAMVMTESGGKEKARSDESTAKGYGQLLDGTSKFVYTNLLEKDGWTSSVALDGSTNLEMMVSYMDYLYDKNDKDLVKAIYAYRGIESTGYVAKINSYLANANKSVYTIASR